MAFHLFIFRSFQHIFVPLLQLEEVQSLHDKASVSISSIEATSTMEKQAKQSDDDSSTKKEEEASKETESKVSKKPESKSSTKKSSRFFSASYFSTDDEGEFSPSTVFSELATVARAQLGKVVIGAALLLAG